ncbi:MAG TPA: DEAD/DEAH box helicase [Spirochaetia bacterium]|nr:DEAD/DEAH box helicase [Spirochaetia bacterium]HRZ88873.1 DEAD/DEAH box helicase [Spirochaetia bacterium]
MNDSDFRSLGLAESLLSTLAEEGYASPTPIQQKTIPSLLAGKDLLGVAQTGTGKTAAFALPILQRLAAFPARPEPRAARVLVVAPTRELAAQIDESFGTYGRRFRFSRACVFGGVGKNPQIKALSRGVDVLTATPGRLLDLHGEGYIRLDRVETVVLDEADRMLDMGFIHDVRRIVALLPKKRQTLLFSATMPRDIAVLASSILDNPTRVDVEPEKPTVDKVDQHILHVRKENKKDLLAHLLRKADVRRAVVFTRTKHGANRLSAALGAEGISSEAIHANKSQNARIRALDGFKRGEIRVLVATDLAARGIDVDGITHVFNYELPNEPETYVHRIGRTARAGASGSALSFCDAEERPLLRQIERLLGRPVPVEADHPYVSAVSTVSAESPAAPAGMRKVMPSRTMRSRNFRSSSSDRGTDNRNPWKPRQPMR